jgi:hypothetical protein
MPFSPTNEVLVVEEDPRPDKRQSITDMNQSSTGANTPRRSKVYFEMDGDRADVLASRDSEFYRLRDPNVNDADQRQSTIVTPPESSASSLNTNLAFPPDDRRYSRHGSVTKMPGGSTRNLMPATAANGSTRNLGDPGTPRTPGGILKRTSSYKDVAPKEGRSPRVKKSKLVKNKFASSRASL